MPPEVNGGMAYCIVFLDELLRSKSVAHRHYTPKLQLNKELTANIRLTASDDLTEVGAVGFAANSRDQGG